MHEMWVIITLKRGMSLTHSGAQGAINQGMNMCGMRVTFSYSGAQGAIKEACRLLL